MAAPVPSIFVQPPKVAGYRFELTGSRTTVGRSASCAVRIPEDVSLSRQHFELVRESDALVVRDLGSRNGTLVNDRRVSAQGVPVQPGDVIAIGETRITVERPKAAALAFGSGEVLPESAGTIVLRVEDLFGHEGAAVAAGTSGAPASAVVAQVSRHLALFEAFTEAGNILGADRPLEEMLSAILERIFTMVPAERGVIALLDEGSLVPKAVRHREGSTISETIVISEGIKEMAIRDRAAVSTLDAQSDPRFAERASIRLSGIRSVVCAPLFTGKDVLGLLYVDTVVAEKQFDREDLTLLSTLAIITAIKVENQRLLRVYLENERIERELSVAAEIAEKLLPARPPEVSGLEVFARNVPCREIGGDYYDFAWAGGTFHFIIVDVSGKGIPASLLMAAIHASFRAYRASSASPAELMGRLNEALFENTPANKYATVFYGQLDPGCGSLRYVNAGHNAPILVRRGGGVEELPERGFPCGMFAVAPYREGEARLEEGDVLASFTDGLPDEVSPGGDQVGTPRLKEWLVEECRRPLLEAGPRLFDRVTAWCEGAHQFDDRTLILMRRHERS